MGKPVAGSLCLKCLNIHGIFFSSKARTQKFFKADRNKLFASNEKQIDNHTLMLEMFHSNMSVVGTYHCRSVFKKDLLVWLLIYVDLCSQKSYLRH